MSTSMMMLLAASAAAAPAPLARAVRGGVVKYVTGLSNSADVYFEKARVGGVTFGRDRSFELAADGWYGVGAWEVRGGRLLVNFVTGSCDRDGRRRAHAHGRMFRCVVTAGPGGRLDIERDE